MILKDLTLRQQQAFYHFMEGLSTKEVAEQMGISYKTVESYRKHILDKSGSKTLHQVIVQYYRYKLAQRKRKSLKNFRVYIFSPNNKRRRKRK